MAYARTVVRAGRAGPAGPSGEPAGKCAAARDWGGRGGVEVRRPRARAVAHDCLGAPAAEPGRDRALAGL